MKAKRRSEVEKLAIHRLSIMVELMQDVAD